LHHEPDRGSLTGRLNVFTSLALGGQAALAGPVVAHAAFGFWWLGFLIPLFWILVFVLIFGVFGRRWRRRAWEHGHGGYGPMRHPVRSAEATLAERFAQGDIDEKDYRARLEVLRANSPHSA
jgi:putative membrane protein